MFEFSLSGSSTLFYKTHALILFQRLDVYLLRLLPHFDPRPFARPCFVALLWFRKPGRIDNIESFARWDHGRSTCFARVDLELFAN